MHNFSRLGKGSILAMKQHREEIKSHNCAEGPEVRQNLNRAGKRTLFTRNLLDSCNSSPVGTSFIGPQKKIGGGEQSK